MDTAILLVAIGCLIVGYLVGWWHRHAWATTKINDEVPKRVRVEQALRAQRSHDSIVGKLKEAMKLPGMKAFRVELIDPEEITSPVQLIAVLGQDSVTTIDDILAQHPSEKALIRRARPMRETPEDWELAMAQLAKAKQMRMGEPIVPTVALKRFIPRHVRRASAGAMLTMLPQSPEVAVIASFDLFDSDSGRRTFTGAPSPAGSDSITFTGEMARLNPEGD